MALPNRYLTALVASTLSVLLINAAFTQVAHAQPDSSANAAAPSPVTFRTLAVGNPAGVEKLLYESQGKSVPLQANTLDLSPAYFAPPGGRVALYRETPAVPPETKPRKVPIAEAQLGATGQYLLLLAAANGGKVTPLAIDDSWSAQPPETLRVFNFSRRRVAIQIGNEASELTTSQSIVAPFPKNSRIVDLKVAVWEKNEWLLASNNPPALIPRTRLILVITDMAPSPENPRPVEVDINGVYDTRPPPEPAKRS